MNIKEFLEKLKKLGLKELADGLKAALTEARDICDSVDQEDRDFTTEERKMVADLLDGAKQIKARIKEVQDDQAMRKQVLELGQGIEIIDSNGGQPGGNGRKADPFRDELRYETLGDAFVKSKEWNDWLSTVAPSGHIAESRKGLTSPPLEFKRFGLFRKTLVTGSSDTSAGAFVVPDYTGIYEPLGRYPLTLRDLVAVRQTTSDTVEFVRQTTQVTQAAPVPEANVTDYSGASGEVSGEKPEGAMAFERVTESVKTIAVWIPATKRALSDAMQLRGLIDQELREDLAEELEDQILNGNGVGENFTGLANTSGTLVQAFDTDINVTGRKAITNLLLNGKQRPTAWLVNPMDWEAIELQTDSEGRYFWGGPMARGPATFWGVPVVQSFFQTQGTAWLGNWMKAVVWDREQAGISVSDSHADFFIRNMIAILAEMRAAFGVIRPSGFVEVDLSGGS
jgi:HK97 family phage major capsid protein